MSLLDLTPDQTKTLEEFRKRVEPLLTLDKFKEDHFLVRWLLARDMNIDKAEEMLKKSLQWRKESQADNIEELGEIPEKYRKRFMFGYVGEDAEGYPILLLPGGRHDHRIVIEEVGMEQLYRWNVIWIEKVMRMVENARAKSGKPIFQYHEIIDLEGYSIRQFGHKPSVDYILYSQKMFDDNYPEVIKSVTVINAPKIFPLFFNLMKPMMTKQMLDKISVFGSDSSKWVVRFKEKGFPMDKLPPRWGGSLPGEDEFCSQEAIWIDAPIPLRYFKEIDGEDEEGFRTVRVPAREKLKIELEIPQKGTKLEWKFQTEVHDISFGVIYEIPGEMDIPVGRVGSNKEMQSGSIITKNKGKVTFVFDNKYSVTTPKVLRYKIDVFLPGEFSK